MINIDRVIFSQTEYRTTAPAVTSSILTADPLSIELAFTSLFLNEADANAFRDSILSVRSLGRSDWQLSCRAEAVSFEVGDTITIYHVRYGLLPGGNFIVKGIKKDNSSLFSIVTLFGPQATV